MSRKRLKPRPWEPEAPGDDPDSLVADMLGSSDRCAFCDRPPTRECHCWTGENRCITVYVCEDHYAARCYQAWRAGVYSHLGYRRLREAADA